MADDTEGDDFSVMAVLIFDRETEPIERAVRRQGNSMSVGSLCHVEFGAQWARQGLLGWYRVAGVEGRWLACRIVRHEGEILLVELLPDPRLSDDD